METRWTNYLLLMLVVGAHGGAIAAASLLWQQQPPQLHELPTISGTLIAAPPAETVTPPAAVKTPQPVAKTEPVPVAKAKPEPKPVAQAKPKPIAKATPKPVAKPEPKPQPTIAAPVQTPPEKIAVTEPVKSAPQPKTVNQTTLNSEAGAPVTEPRRDASRNRTPQPHYPRLSQRRGEQGTVLLELVILEDGTVGNVRVKQSSGYPRLDRSALETVQGWKYIPATRGGTPIEYKYVQPIKFSLRG